MLQGVFVSEVVSVIFRIGSVIWLKEVTDSPEIVGLFIMALSLPLVFFTPVGGAVADRFSRRRVIICCNLAHAALALIAFVAMSVSQDMAFSITLLFVAAVGIGSIGAISMPSVLATIPDIVPKISLERANGWLMGAIQLSMLAGRLSAGALLLVLGAPVLILIKGLGHLCSATAESFITVPYREPKQAQGMRDVILSFGSDTLGGFSYLLEKRGLVRLYLMIALLDFLIAPCWVLLPFFIEETLKLTLEWYGFFLSAIAFGTIVGNIIPAKIYIKAAHRGRIFFSAVLCASVSLLSLGVASHAIFAVFALVSFGVCLGFVNILALSTIQRCSPSHVHGRVLGLFGMFRTASMSFSMGLSGVVAGLLANDAAMFFLACGLFGLMAFPLLIVSRGFHRLMACETE